MVDDVVTTGATASADVVASGPVRCLAWEHGTLRAFLERHPAIRQTLQVILGEDLARKLGSAPDTFDVPEASPPGEE